jgi:hypothetical protein
MFVGSISRYFNVVSIETTATVAWELTKEYAGDRVSTDRRVRKSADFGISGAGSPILPVSRNFQPIDPVAAPSGPPIAVAVVDSGIAEHRDLGVAPSSRVIVSNT